MTFLVPNRAAPPVSPDSCGSSRLAPVWQPQKLHKKSPSWGCGGKGLEFIEHLLCARTVKLGASWPFHPCRSPRKADDCHRSCFMLGDGEARLAPSSHSWSGLEAGSHPGASQACRFLSVQAEGSGGQRGKQGGTFLLTESAGAPEGSFPTGLSLIPEAWLCAALCVPRQAGLMSGPAGGPSGG